LTFTDFPDLVFYNNTSSQSGNNSTKIKFLSDEKYTTNYSLTPFQTFGIKGSLYPYSIANFTYPFDQPMKMDLQPIYLKNKLSLYLSDFTVNSLLYMGYQSGNLFTTVNNDTTGLPFTFDTKGLGLIVPELTDFFPNKNYNVSLKIEVSLSKQNFPTISTQVDGSLVHLNFGMNFDVHNESSVYDDPFNAVYLNVDSYLKIRVFTDKDLINVIIPNVIVNKVNATSHIGKINEESEERIRKTLESLIKVAVQQFSKKITNIDVIKKLNDLTGIKFFNFLIHQNLGHYVVSINHN